MTCSPLRLRISSGARSRNTTQRTASRRGAAPRAHGVCMSHRDHRTARKRGRTSSKNVVPGSGVRIVNPARPSSCAPTNAHKRSKSASAQSGSITEIARNAVTEFCGRDADRINRAIDARVLHKAGQPFIGGRFQPEEDVEILSDRPPRLQQLWMGRHEIGPALHKESPLSDAAPGLRARAHRARRLRSG